MMKIPAFSALAIIGCLPLSEQRTDPEEVVWSGYVLTSTIESNDLIEFDEGTVTVHDVEGTLLAEASQPDSNSPGVWEVTVPVNTQVAFRLSGPEHATAVWRGLSPQSERSYWLSGALYTHDMAVFESLLEDLSTTFGLALPPISESEAAMMYGQPLSPDTWANADVRVTDGQGQSADVILFTINEEGEYMLSEGGAVDLFIAPDLATGAVQLDVTTEDGNTSTTIWPAQAGEILMADYYVLASDS